MRREGDPLETESPALSPDLEWMLLGSQASPAMLAEALVREYYAPVYRLALSILADEGAARQAVPGVFGQALQDAHLYREGTGVQNWLYRLALTHLHSNFKQLPIDDLGGEKLEALLERLPGEPWPEISLSDEEQGNLIAGILKASGVQARRGRLISYLRDFLLVALVLLVMGGLAWASNRLSPQPVEIVPTRSSPTISPSRQGPESVPVDRIYQRLYIVQPGDTLPSISARTGTSVEKLKGMNYLGDNEPLEPGRVLMFSYLLPTRTAATPTPVIPAAPAEAPLTEKAASQEIYQRLASSSSNWHTLWADLRQIEYGPEGYVGPPLVGRLQVWISQPGQRLELYGSPEVGVEYEYLNTGGLLYMAQNDQDYVSVIDAPSLIGVFGNEDLFFPGEAPWLKVGALLVAGSSQIAGRSALIVDRLDPAGKRTHRLWIDTRTGALLRVKWFGDRDDAVVLSDYAVTAVSFDVDFPLEVFDPGRMPLQRFAQDYRAPPETGESRTASAWAFPDSRPRLERLSPPAGFDPSLSQLTFQYPPGPPVSGWQDATPQGVELFAGEFYLGSLQIANPLFNPYPCRRSPDGNQIAYFSDINMGELVWIDLAHPGEIRGPPETLNASDFAFGPDSRTLAIEGAGFEAGRWVQGLFTLDTGSGEYQPLVELEYASDMVWSPDGAYLALIGKELASSPYEAMIVRAGTGRIVYRTPVDVRNIPGEPDPNWPAPDWPARDWGVEFPNSRPDRVFCSFPNGGRSPEPGNIRDLDPK